MFWVRIQKFLFSHPLHPFREALCLFQKIEICASLYFAKLCFFKLFGALVNFWDLQVPNHWCHPKGEGHSFPKWYITYAFRPKMEVTEPKTFFKFFRSDFQLLRNPCKKWCFWPNLMTFLTFIVLAQWVEQVSMLFRKIEDIAPTSIDAYSWY